MRIPGSWNALLVISLLFILFLLNYFNLVPLSKTLPFLSFLPHESRPRVFKQVVTATPSPTPQPLPPITVKRVDPVKGEGEFVINNPTPQAVQLSPEKQIVLDGIYDTNTKKVTISTSVQNSTIPIHPIPPVLGDSFATVLTLEMITKGNNTPVYQTNISLTRLESVRSLPFRVRLPFYNEFVVKIYQGSQELLSQPIKL